MEEIVEHKQFLFYFKFGFKTLMLAKNLWEGKFNNRCIEGLFIE